MGISNITYNLFQLPKGKLNFPADHRTAHKDIDKHTRLHTYILTFFASQFEFFNFYQTKKILSENVLVFFSLFIISFFKFENFALFLSLSFSLIYILLCHFEYRKQNLSAFIYLQAAMALHVVELLKPYVCHTHTHIAVKVQFRDDCAVQLCENRFSTAMVFFFNFLCVYVYEYVCACECVFVFTLKSALVQ